MTVVKHQKTAQFIQLKCRVFELSKTAVISSVKCAVGLTLQWGRTVYLLRVWATEIHCSVQLICAFSTVQLRILTHRLWGA
jgi:hypothetical protein